MSQANKLTASQLLALIETIHGGTWVIAVIIPKNLSPWLEQAFLCPMEGIRTRCR